MTDEGSKINTIKKYGEGENGPAKTQRLLINLPKTSLYTEIKTYYTI